MVGTIEEAWNVGLLLWAQQQVGKGGVRGWGIKQVGSGWRHRWVLKFGELRRRIGIGAFITLGGATTDRGRLYRATSKKSPAVNRAEAGKGNHKC